MDSKLTVKINSDPYKSVRRLYTKPVITIKKDSIINNYKLLNAQVSPAICSAVVKNNAYGIGLKFVIDVLYKTGCRIFWVAHAIEAIELSKYHYIEPNNIFVLQGFGADTLPIFLQYNFVPVINSIEQVYLWQLNQTKLSKPIVQLDTGLNRLGLTMPEWQYCLEHNIFNSKNIKYLISHLACADSASHFMNEYQYSNFLKMTNMLPGVPRSLAASDGVMLGKNYNFDLVRCGAALYGINTSPYRENKMQAVLNLSAPILQIKSIKSGDYVGYGATFKAHQPKKIAIISIGYGDGLPCSLQNIGKAWIQNYEIPYAGRISMDAVTLDVSNIPDKLLYPGQMVELLNDFYTADDMGHDAGTIGYEILSNFSRKDTRLQIRYI